MSKETDFYVRSYVQIGYFTKFVVGGAITYLFYYQIVNSVRNLTTVEAHLPQMKDHVRMFTISPETRM